MSGRRLLRAVTRSIEEEEGRKAILKHFVARPARVQELYAEMVEDVCDYRDILIEVSEGRQ